VKNWDLVTTLVSSKRHIKFEQSELEDALFKAVLENTKASKKAAIALIKAGATGKEFFPLVMKTRRESKTVNYCALHVAVAYGNKEVMKLLVKRGLDRNTPTGGDDYYSDPTQPQFSPGQILSPRDEKGESIYAQAMEEIDKQLPARIEQFKKIYSALMAGQSTFFKKNFLSGKDKLTNEQLEAKILAYIKKDPRGRTAKAWELSGKSKFLEGKRSSGLFRAVYKWAFEHSGPFKKSNLIGHKTFFKSSSLDKAIDQLDQAGKNEIAENKTDQRAVRIRRALG